MVQPLECDRVASGGWQIALRCPECEWSGTGVFTDDELASLSDEVERGTSQIVADLHTLAQANFEADVEQFIEALRADLIRPEDF